MIKFQFNNIQYIDRFFFYLSWFIIGCLVLRVINEYAHWIELPYCFKWIWPVISSAAVGYLTNWLAIWMLFKPYERRFKIFQGVIPREKKQLGIGLGEQIPKHLLNPEQIADELTLWVRDTLKKEETRALISKNLQGYVKERREKLVEGTTDLIVKETALKQVSTLFPSVRGMIEKQLYKMCDKVAEDQELMDHAGSEIADKIEGMVEGYIQTEGKNAITEKLNLSGRIESAVDRMDMKQLHEMINDVSGRHLVAIQVLGFLIGAVVGAILSLA